MKKFKITLLLLVIVVGSILGGCASNNSVDKNDIEPPQSNDHETSEPLTEISLAMVTDEYGIYDQLINKIAWQGITEFAEENGLEEGDQGYDLLQSKNAEEYYSNVNDFISRDFDLIFGIGAFSEEQIAKVADEQSEVNFAIVDNVIEADNIANIMFLDQQGAFLAGVVAALQTKTNKIGFIGGEEIPVVERFETGFRAAIREVNPELKVEVQYTGTFAEEEIGKELANEMYSSGVDVIFQVAGESGKGVFAEAKERKQQNPDTDIWVIGSMTDQYEEGKINDTSITLTSIIKNVDVGIKDVATKTMRGQFPGGKIITYEIQHGAFEVVDSHGLLSEEIINQVNIWRNELVKGTVDCCA